MLLFQVHTFFFGDLNFLYDSFILCALISQGFIFTGLFLCHYFAIAKEHIRYTGDLGCVGGGKSACPDLFFNS